MVSLMKCASEMNVYRVWNPGRDTEEEEGEMSDLGDSLIRTKWEE